MEALKRQMVEKEAAALDTVQPKDKHSAQPRIQLQPAAVPSMAAPSAAVLANVSNSARNNAIVIIDDDSPVNYHKQLPPTNWQPPVLALPGMVQSSGPIVPADKSIDYDDPEDKDYIPTNQTDFHINTGKTQSHVNSKLPGSANLHNPDAFNPNAPPLAIPGLALPTGNAFVSVEEREKQLMHLMTSVTAVVDKVQEEDKQVPGLKCTLMPHQVQGVKWMMSREAGDQKGGILADDMGLGKTVQTIALILQNRPGARRNTIEWIREPDAEEQDRINGRVRRKPAPKPKKKVPAPAPKQKNRPIIIDSDDEVDSNLVPDNADAVDDEIEEEELDRSDIKSSTTLIIAPLAVLYQWEKEIASKSTKVPALPLHELKDTTEEPNEAGQDHDGDDEEVAFNRALKKMQLKDAIKELPHSKPFSKLRVLVHHGNTKAKSARQLREYDVVITTYTTVVAEYKNTFAAGASGSKGTSSKKKSNTLDSDDDDGTDVAFSEDNSSDEDEEDSDDGRFINDDSDLGEYSNSDDEVEHLTTRPAKVFVPPKLGDSKSKKKSSSKSAPRKISSGKRKKVSANGKPTPLFEMDWLRIVLDEAQNVKNHTTQAAKAAYLLSSRATSRWCLTGTPIQNSVYELWSLIHFLRIKPFDEYMHFKEKIGEALDPKKRNIHQNTINWAMKRLHAVLQAILLRRTKETMHEGKKLIELPPKHISLVEIPDFEEPLERQVYNLLEERIQSRVLEAEEAGTTRGFGQMQILLMLMRLRQACSHPGLLQDKIDIDVGSAAPAPVISSSAKSGGSSEDIDSLAALIGGMDVNGPPKCERCHLPLTGQDAEPVADDGDGDDSIVVMQNLTRNGRKMCAGCAEIVDSEREAGIDWSQRSSTKVNAILKILADVQDKGEGEKTIVFSQFTQFLDLLEPHLRRSGFKYERYDGSMKPDQRELALNRVKERADKTVLLISFRAGSTGLNLTFCNHVILTEAWWNPALEDQAFDRAHRLGQQRETFIYKLCIADTVDLRILALQEKKRQLAESALEGAKLKANRLDRAELLKLFGGAAGI
ncbi:hypothetical protein OC846_005673 [Tilletia horrida]|uniref:Helicase C-terminal domain-containing protein n=1 Tax=Tilletia horrida TaxID=155126 RepID=A0AAN6GKU5_9BASI|nr:hypothetical protein OC845_005243 [Tilletia horrida]KAK0545431.1 hypothetical protein OC846_005673 [Tilletia horrida]KAK0568701.1 hypothetical protein OC861_001703 [Tilletia horrida]